MCYKGNCFFCIPVENGCLALAILSAVTTCLALVTSLILGILTAAGIIFATREVHHSGIYFNDHYYEAPGTETRNVTDEAVLVAGMAVATVIALVAIASLIAFIFSVLLCNGICNRRPGQVMAYFIYGVVITVLAAVASVIYLIIMQDPHLDNLGILGLFGCVVYSLFLVLVHQTYTKLSRNNGAVYKDHIRLVEG